MSNTEVLEEEDETPLNPFWIKGERSIASPSHFVFEMCDNNRNLNTRMKCYSVSNESKILLTLQDRTQRPIVSSLGPLHFTFRFRIVRICFASNNKMTQCDAFPFICTKEIIRMTFTFLQYILELNCWPA